MPEVFFQQNPNHSSTKKLLKLWVRGNIPPDGDDIFKGKLRKKDHEDWLSLEVTEWRRRMEHEEDSRREWEDLEENWEN